MIMEQVSQIELVKELTLKLKETKRNDAEILATFVSAGILNSNRKYTRHYSSLQKIDSK